MKRVKIVNGKATLKTKGKVIVFPTRDLNNIYQKSLYYSYNIIKYVMFRQPTDY